MYGPYRSPRVSEPYHISNPFLITTTTVLHTVTDSPRRITNYLKLATRTDHETFAHSNHICEATYHSFPSLPLHRAMHISLIQNAPSPTGSSHMHHVKSEHLVTFLTFLN
eukprot:807620_1